MNNYICQLESSASIELIKKANDMVANGIPVIGLAGGEPDFDTPIPIKEKLIEELNKNNTHYAVGKGILKLREKIRIKLEKENNILVNTEDIIITPGAKMAIYLAIRSCINNGDQVMILTPAWVSYSEIIKAAGGVPIFAELNEGNNFRITYDFLEKHYTSNMKMIIINSPNNPTGRIINEDEIQAISKFACSRNLLIVSDEIYEKIVFDRKQNISLASNSELCNRTITINGFSKAFAMTGWRIGYLTACSKIINIIYKLHTHTITGVSPFIQEAATVAFDCKNDVEYMRSIYENRRNYLIKELSQMNFIQFVKPEGAFYLWLKFKLDNPECVSISDYLLKKCNIITVPGIAYGIKQNNYVRLSFANSTDKLKSAIHNLKYLL